MGKEITFGDIEVERTATKFIFFRRCRYLKSISIQQDFFW